MVSIPIISAWIVMVALGVIGHELDKPELFVSYWLVLAICTLITIPFGLLKWAITRDGK